MELWFGIISIPAEWVWIMAVALVLTVSWCTEAGRTLWLVGALVLVLALVYFGGLFNVVNWIAEHWALALGIAAACFVTGIPWAIAKWKFHTNTWRFACDDAVKLFRIRHARSHLLHKVGGIRADSDEGKKHAELQAALEDENKLRQYMAQNGLLPKQPDFRDCKDVIVVWALYWPFSLLWTVLDGLFSRLFRHLFRDLFRGLLERAADSAERQVVVGIEQALSQR